MSRPSKRRRTDNAQTSFGAPTEDDTPSARQTASSISPSGYSVRSPPNLDRMVSSLTTLCARAFIHSLKGLTEDNVIWERQKEWLEALPDHIIPKLFAMLRAEVPDQLISPFITKVSQVSRIPNQQDSGWMGSSSFADNP